MNAKTIVITGGSDGIGAAAARLLAAQGHNIVIVGRNASKTEQLAQRINARSFVSDFASLAQVRQLAADLKAELPRIDVLANNAGGIFDAQRTVDGFERTLQINHLAPFLLTNLLMPTLIDSGATIINTSSVGAKIFGNIDLDDLNNDKKYSANKAYGDAKLANILFTRELHRRFNAQGIAAAAFHPGNVATNFASDTTSFMRLSYQGPLRRFVGLVTPDKGADTLMWLAQTVPGADWESGQYYVNRKVAKTHKQADDAALVAKHWELSAHMVGLT